MTLPIATLLAFALVSLLVELTPGPNMAYLALLTLSRGRTAGLLATAGVAAGLLLVGLAAAFGAATIMSSSTIAYEVLRWSGVVFLLWLAWEGWIEADAPMGAMSADEHRHLLRGLITNLLNPKAALFYLAVLPAFVAGHGATLDATIVLTLVYVAVATTVHTAIVLLAGSLNPILHNLATTRTLRAGLPSCWAGPPSGSRSRPPVKADLTGRLIWIKAFDWLYSDTGRVLGHLG